MKALLHLLFDHRGAAQGARLLALLRLSSAILISEAPGEVMLPRAGPAVDSRAIARRLILKEKRMSLRRLETNDNR